METTGAIATRWLLDLSILLLALTGFSISLYLLFQGSFNGDDGVAGCGGSHACVETLTSQWSHVLGMPVSLLGLLSYVGLMLGMTPRGSRFLPMMFAVPTGAALWFVFVQAVLIGKFCPWCMAAHGVAFSVIVFGYFRLREMGGRSKTIRQLGLFTVLAFFGISLLQLYGPRMATHRIEKLAKSTLAADENIHARGEGRKVQFADGILVYNADELPHLGPADAKRVMVEYFDYQCPACRTMYGYLAALMKKYPQDLCVILLPVPLENGCNKAISDTNDGHPWSCDYARLGMALWRCNPDAYAEFHENALSGMSVGDAQQFADRLVPSEKLDDAMKQPWIHDLIQADIRD